MKDGKVNKYQYVATVLHEMKNLSWENSPVRDSNNFEIWLPIIRVFENEAFLGISKLGYWVLERDKYIVLLLEGRNLRDLLPCLQKPYSEIISLIDEALTQKSLTTEIRETFPIRDLILSGLRIGSDFWANLALGWLENLQLDDEIKIELQKLVKMKWASQKTKLKVRKILTQMPNL